MLPSPPIVTGFNPAFISDEDPAHSVAHSSTADLAVRGASSCLLLASRSSRRDGSVSWLLLQRQIRATPMTDTHNRFLGNRALSPETLMMGYGYDPFLSERSLKPPLFQTSTFVFRSAQDGKEFFELAYGLRQKHPNEEPGLIYSRINNPDLEMLEDRLAIWDQAEASLVFASGMAAISTTLWAYARPSTVIIHSGPVYGGTDFLLKKILPQ